VNKLSISPLGTLYLVFASFFATVFFRSNDSAVTEYVSSLICLLLMGLAMMANHKNVAHKRWQYVLSICVAAFSIILMVSHNSPYAVILYIKITVLIWFFSTFNIARSDFIEFVNKTYLFYLVASILVWLGVVPNVFYEDVKLPDYFADYGIISFYILRGIEGSPAAIDTYSAFVLLMNLFLNSGNERKIYLSAAVVGLLASFRMTPFVSLFLVFLLYPWYSKSKTIATVILISSAIIFFAILTALYLNESITLGGAEYNLRAMAYNATHARSMIWVQQLDVMSNRYSFMDYIFGRFSPEEFSVPTYQSEGTETGSVSLNPHNNYLLLWFRSPIMFAVFFAAFLIAQYKSYSKETFPLLLLIFFAAFTNSTLVGLGNPIYLFTIIFLLTEHKRLPAMTKRIWPSRRVQKVRGVI